MQGSKEKSKAEKGSSVFGDLPFVVTAAHEMKAPLSLVRQLALALESDTLDIDARRRISHQIILTTERALRLMTDLSKSSRLEDSLFELEPINPYQICEEVAHELTPLYKARGKEIYVSSRYRPVLVIANRDLLRRVILNFGDNALHYADSDLPVELRASSVARGQQIRMSVRDYGPAIAPDMWQRLRKSLGTGTQVLHNRPQSSGLGLYIANQFANTMQGNIGATRHRDGATFFIDLTASRQLSLL